MLKRGNSWMKWLRKLLIMALKDRAQAEMNGLDYLEKLDERTSFYRVKNLGVDQYTIE